MNKIYSFILAFILSGLIASTLYLSSSQESKPERESVVAARVIDGDTLVLQDGRTLRLLNINAPEKNVPSSTLSKKFMESLTDKEISVEITSKDKYQRNLARVYFKNSSEEDYINLKLVSLGLASKFLVSESELDDFTEAEKEAIENSRGIWNKSQYYGCFSSKIDEKNEIITLTSNCPNINMNGWTIKDESRKLYKFPSIVLNRIIIHSSNGEDNSTDLFWNSKTDIWNNDRDSLYLFDSKGNIAYYETYGY